MKLFTQNLNNKKTTTKKEKTMLKKTLLFAMIALCVSAFAATIDICKFDFKNLTAEQINEMKVYLSSANKKKYETAVISIALYKYNNPNEDLTLAKMEEIAKSVYGEKKQGGNG